MSEQQDFAGDQNGIFLLYRQFAETLQAITALSKGLEEVHLEMRTYAKTLTEVHTRLAPIEERMTALIRLTQGEGTGDSLYKDSILHDTRIKVLEDWKITMGEAVRHNKTNALTKITIIVSIVIGVITAIFSSFGPTIIDFFKHSSHSP